MIIFKESADYNNDDDNEVADDDHAKGEGNKSKILDKIKDGFRAFYRSLIKWCSMVIGCQGSDNETQRMWLRKMRFKYWALILISVGLVALFGVLALLENERGFL